MKSVIKIILTIAISSNVQFLYCQDNGFFDTTYVQFKYKDFDSLRVRMYGSKKLFRTDSTFYENGKVVIQKNQTKYGFKNEYYFYGNSRYHLHFEHGKLTGIGVYDYSVEKGNYKSYDAETFELKFVKEGIDSVWAGNWYSISENDKMMAEGVYVKSNNSLIEYSYQPNGQLHYVIERDTLKRANGLWQEFGLNGKIRFEARFKEGLKHGYSYHYSDHGVLKKIELFEMDILIKTVDLEN